MVTCHFCASKIIAHPLVWKVFYFCSPRCWAAYRRFLGEDMTNQSVKVEKLLRLPAGDVTTPVTYARATAVNPRPGILIVVSLDTQQALDVFDWNQWQYADIRTEDGLIIAEFRNSPKTNPNAAIPDVLDAVYE